MANVMVEMGLEPKSVLPQNPPVVFISFLACNLSLIGFAYLGGSPSNCKPLQGKDHVSQFFSLRPSTLLDSPCTRICGAPVGLQSGGDLCFSSV